MIELFLTPERKKETFLTIDNRYFRHWYNGMLNIHLFEQCSNLLRQNKEEKKKQQNKCCNFIYFMTTKDQKLLIDTVTNIQYKSSRQSTVRCVMCIIFRYSFSRSSFSQLQVAQMLCFPIYLIYSKILLRVCVCVCGRANNELINMSIIFKWIFHWPKIKLQYLLEIV